tara:strand:+ start:472 stop:705 length:234 start_codon:yes stop_codon:yes gene_type:complete
MFLAVSDRANCHKNPLFVSTWLRSLAKGGRQMIWEGFFEGAPGKSGKNLEEMAANHRTSYKAMTALFERHVIEKLSF